MRVVLRRGIGKFVDCHDGSMYDCGLIVSRILQGRHCRAKGYLYTGMCRATVVRGASNIELAVYLINLSVKVSQVVA
jgi:hypothetical protein